MPPYIYDLNFSACKTGKLFFNALNKSGVLGLKMDSKKPTNITCRLIERKSKNLPQYNYPAIYCRKPDIIMKRRF